MKQEHKPNWWLLYLTAPLLVVLLIGESRLPESPDEHRILEIGIVLVVFGLMAVWVRANDAALIQEEYEMRNWRLERDPNAEPDLDPHHLPLAEVGEDLDRDPYQVEASPSKGRDN